VSNLAPTSKFLKLIFFVLFLSSRLTFASLTDDVPSQKANLTVDEERALQKWDPKDPKKGFEGEDDDGNYYYEAVDAGTEKDASDDVVIEPKKENYEKGLQSVMKDGSYLFETEESEQSGSFSMRFGSMAAPEIINEEDVYYVDIYSDKALNVLFLDYSLQAQMFGKWGLTIGSGVGQSTAPGRFRSNPIEEALEKYTIYMLPNHLSFSYRFQYTKKPYFAPYISGGFCNYAFIEKRDDNRKMKGIFARPGIFCNTYTAFSLDSEYGINNIWLDLEYKVVKGLQENRDISANIINGGISFDF
jgi:hypothetical protein